MKKFQHTPLSAAKALRKKFEENIAKSTGDYVKQQVHTGFWLNAWTFSQLVYEQCGVKMTEAEQPFPLEVRQTIEEVVPEFFAEYWESKFF